MAAVSVKTIYSSWTSKMSNKVAINALETKNRLVGRNLQALNTKYTFKILLRKQKRVTKSQGKI